MGMNAYKDSNESASSSIEAVTKKNANEKFEGIAKKIKELKEKGRGGAFNSYNDKNGDRVNLKYETNRSGVGGIICCEIFKTDDNGENVVFKYEISSNGKGEYKYTETEIKMPMKPVVKEKIFKTEGELKDLIQNYIPKIGGPVNEIYGVETENDILKIAEAEEKASAKEEVEKLLEDIS